jgi:hypothetical protein
MTGPNVPPQSSSSSYSSTPAGTPPKSGPPWGKIALFGCGGLLVIGLVITGIVVAIYMMRDDDQTVVAPVEPTTGTSTTTTTTPSTGVVGGTPDVRTGTLAPGDATAPDGSWYDNYPISFPVGTVATITMRSNDFDTYISVHAPSGATYSDDDSGGGTDSQVRITIDEPGTWNVWANSLRTGDTGNYTLSIERTP